MTSTQPCRLHEWITEVGELKTGLERPTLGRRRRKAAGPLSTNFGRSCSRSCPYLVFHDTKTVLISPSSRHPSGPRYIVGHKA